MKHFDFDKNYLLEHSANNSKTFKALTIESVKKKNSKLTTTVTIKHKHCLDDSNNWSKT